MKRISYIVFGALILALASCQKEVIRPNDPAHNASEIEWKSTELGLDKESGKRSTSSQDKVGTDPNAANSGGTGGAANSGDGTTDDSGITDPNNDPDAAKKKGKK